MRIMFSAASSTTLAPSGQGGLEQGRGCVAVEGADAARATDAVGKAMSERRLTFPPKLRRRMYTDRQKAEALQLLSEINDNQRVSERTGVPRSTLSQWRIRYQTDERFARRIDLFLAEG